MAYNGNITKHAVQYTSATDVTAEQYTFFKRSTGDTVVQANAGEVAVGVLWFAQAAANSAVSVITGGEPHVYVGTGGITVGAEVASDDEGQAVAAVANDVVVGIARETATAGNLARIDFLGEAQYVKA